MNKKEINIEKAEKLLKAEDPSNYYSPITVGTLQAKRIRTAETPIDKLKAEINGIVDSLEELRKDKKYDNYIKNLHMLKQLNMIVKDVEK